MIPLPPIRKPAILGRAAWLAGEPTEPLAPLGLPRRICVHHAAVLSKHWKGGKTVLAIQGNHQAERGFADIGYHFLIGPDGTIWAGVPTDRKGFHCGGIPPAGVTRRFGNTGTFGICVFGDFDREPVPKAAYNYLIALISWLCFEYKIRMDQVFGHFEAWSNPPKTCPGKHLATDLFKERWERAFPGNK